MRRVRVLIRLAVAAVLILSPQAPAFAICTDYGQYAYWAGGAGPAISVDVAVAGNYAYTAELENGMAVYDVSDPAHPHEVGRIPSPGHYYDRAYGVAVAGNHVYVARNEAGLQVVDVSQPSSPDVVGTVDTPGIAQGVAVQDSYAYVADSDSLQVIGVSDPSAPVRVGAVVIPGQAYDVAVMGGDAYVAAGTGGLQIVDVSNPASPHIVASVPEASSAYSVTADGTFAYVSCGAGGLWIINVSNPAAPQIAGQLNTPVNGVAVAGGFAYAAGPLAGLTISGLSIIDLSDPASPAVLGTVGVTGTAQSVALAGDHAYLASNLGGLHIINVAHHAVAEVVGSAPTQANAVDVAVAGGIAWIAQNGVNPNNLGRLTAMDLANPESPQTIGSVGIPGHTAAVAVAGRYAFVVDQTDPQQLWPNDLQVVDISNPAAPHVTGSVELAASPSGVAARGHYVYVPNGAYAVTVIDASDPASPRIVSSLDPPGAAEYYGIAIRGSYAFVSGTNVLQVVDISNPLAPAALGSVALPGPSGVSVDLAGDYAYVADGGEGLQVVDVADPVTPRLVGSTGTRGTAASVSVTGHHAYVADREFGLDLVDISDPAAPLVMGMVQTPLTAIAEDVAAAGDHAFVADGYDGLQVARLQCEPIGSFALLSPADGDSILTTEPDFGWRKAVSANPADTVRYTVYCSSGSGLTGADSVSAGTDTTVTFPPGVLHVHTTYHWTVRASAAGSSRLADPSAGYTFHITSDNTPVLIAPTAVAQDGGILVSWNVSGGTDVTGFKLYRRAEGSEWECIAPDLRAGSESESWLDGDVEPGVRYEYMVEGWGPGGAMGRFGPVSAEAIAPVGLALRVSPNPGAGVMTLTLALPRGGDVSLRAYDAQGRQVARTVLPGVRAGVRQVQWDLRDAAGRPLAGGSYYVRMDAPSGQRTARWVVVR